MKNKRFLAKDEFAFAILGVAGFVLFLTFMILAAVNAGTYRRDLFAETIGISEPMSITGSVDVTSGDTTEIKFLPTTVQVDDGESVTVTIEFPASVPHPAILFSNNRYGVTVRAGNEVLYSVNTSAMKKHLMFYNEQIVRIPEGTETLTLTFEGSRNNTYELPSVEYASQECLVYRILRKELPTLALLVLLSVTGLLVLFLIIFFTVKKMMDSRLYSLFAFLLFSIIWGFCDSDLPMITRISQEIVGVLCYMSLLAMSIPVCTYIWRTLERKHPVFPVFALIGAANLVIMSLLCLFGVARLEHTFYSAFILFIIDMVLTFIYFLHDIEHEEQYNENTLTFVGTAIAIVAGMGSILTYFLGHPLFYRNLLLGGILVFLIFLLFAVMSRFVRISNERRSELTEMQMYEHFSYYDSLTGLQNRRAFENRLEKLEKELPADADAILVMMDVNGLKMTNDTFGHAAGDDLIVAAAKRIEQAFGDAGDCYRIGGDEFTAVITDMTKSVSACESDLEELIRKCNESSMWKLSIAHGYSHLLRRDGKQISISDWKQEADLRMYMNKKNNPNSMVRNHEKDFRSIIDCIISTVEARDVYTASHSDRVRELSLCIADAMGVSPSTREHLALAAHLHDIGKIGIPDRVLFKPGRLTDEEFATMKEHPVIGAEVVSRAPSMTEVAQTILHHHERYNGTGYPDGLSGDQIPMTSRIIAIADSIDAMTSRRCYREPFSIDHCKAEIERCTGTMYDPVIAKITLEHWEEIEKIILMHPKRLIDKENEQAENAMPEYMQ